MTTLPLWAVFAVGFGSPILAFAGVLLAQVLSRRGANELDARSRREEVMRILRWAAELAVSGNEATAQLGVAELNALAESDLLDEKEKLFIDAALQSVIQEVTEEIEEIEAGGVDTEVVEDREDHATATDEVTVSWVTEQPETAEGDDDA